MTRSDLLSGTVRPARSGHWLAAPSLRLGVGLVTSLAAATAMTDIAAARSPLQPPGAPVAKAAAPARAATVAPADEASCRLVQIEMTPGHSMQIVVWIEDAAGNYVDTAFITQLTGTYGLGNRPGMMEFNSGYRWPYGRRTSTFPVWAHRHGLVWPLIVFQDGDDGDLSHAMGQSSTERFFCRPIREQEALWDTQTCATTPYTDKGRLSPTETSLYPPRQDIEFASSIDDEGVKQYENLNPFDAVSRATPPGNESFRVDWQIPDGLPMGDYVVWVEVSKEFDQNESYDYPEPVGIPWQEYGVPYRGQPSVVYKVPFSLTPGSATTASTAEYAGYGDPDGIDGEIRPPDATITTGVAGSGASRLQLNVDGDEMYRVRVNALPFVSDQEQPGAPDRITVVDASPSTATLSFTAPGDDDTIGNVAGYEVRYLAGAEMSAANFEEGVLASVQMSLAPAGEEQTLEIQNLLPRLDYSIGVRAFDECKNYGGIQVVRVTTPELSGGHVDACFVATAAYGSLLERDVEMLRRFRDRFLRTHVTGELLVQTYYTFGPALARLIAPSDTLRRAARATLAPLVERVRGLAPRR
jgi:hypothetical protein